VILKIVFIILIKLLNNKDSTDMMKLENISDLGSDGYQPLWVQLPLSVIFFCRLTFSK